MTKRPALTKREALKAIRWYFRKFGLQDWSVKLDWQDTPPDWMPDEESLGVYAYCNPAVRIKRAFVWVAPGTIVGSGEDLLAVVFHECGHVLLRDLEKKVTDLGRWEFMFTRLGELMAELYRSKDKEPRPLRIARDDG